MVKKGCTSAVSSVCDSNVNEGIVGVYWVDKGHMVPEAIGGQASDSICHLNGVTLLCSTLGYEVAFFLV